MKNIIYKITFCLTLFLLRVNVGNAQEYTTYFMHSVPQSLHLNPSERMNYGFALALPAVSSNYVTVTNSGYVISDLAQVNNGVLQFKLNDLPSLSKDNVIRANLQMDIFGVYMNFKKWQLSLYGKERLDYSSVHDPAAIGLLANGNGSYLGKSVNFAPEMNADWTREITVAAAIPFADEAFTLGFGVKYLMGLASFGMNDANLSVTTDDQFYQTTLKSQGGFYTAGIPSLKDTAAFNNIDYTQLALNMNNTTIQFDLGATAKLGDFVIAASALNLGPAIEWKKDVHYYQFGGSEEGASYTFDGIDFLDTANIGGTSFIDSLQKLTDFQEVSELPGQYKTQLPSRYLVSGRWQPNRKFSLGALVDVLDYQGDTDLGFAVNATKDFGSVLGLSLNYAYTEYNPMNLGGGLIIKLAIFEFYAISDNILSGIISNDQRAISARFGLNFVFGRKKDEKAPSIEDLLNK